MKVAILTANQKEVLEAAIVVAASNGFKLVGSLSMTTDSNNNITYGVIMVKDGE